MNDVEYIADALSEEALLRQLAEEGVELAHAALKLIRAIDTSNPTPVKPAEAMEALEVEFVDVHNAFVILNAKLHYRLLPEEKFDEISERKIRRWAGRLGQ